MLHTVYCTYSSEGGGRRLTVSKCASTYITTQMIDKKHRCPHPLFFHIGPQNREKRAGDRSSGTRQERCSRKHCEPCMPCSVRLTPLRTRPPHSPVLSLYGVHAGKSSRHASSRPTVAGIRISHPSHLMAPAPRSHSMSCCSSVLRCVPQLQNGPPPPAARYSMPHHARTHAPRSVILPWHASPVAPGVLLCRPGSCGQGGSSREREDVCVTFGLNPRDTRTSPSCRAAAVSFSFFLWNPSQRTRCGWTRKLSPQLVLNGSQRRSTVRVWLACAPSLNGGGGC